MSIFSRMVTLATVETLCSPYPFVQVSYKDVKFFLVFC